MKFIIGLCLAIAASAIELMTNALQQGPHQMPGCLVCILITVGIALMMTTEIYWTAVVKVPVLGQLLLLMMVATLVGLGLWFGPFALAYYTAVAVLVIPLAAFEGL